MEKIQKRALKLVYNDYDSGYHDLIERFGTDTMLQSRLKKIILEVFKSLKEINPAYIRDISKPKDQPYFLRNPLLLIQSKMNTTNFGLRSYSYLSSKLWNELPADFKDIENVDINLFKSRLKEWSAPDQYTSVNPLL